MKFYIDTDLNQLVEAPGGYRRAVKGIAVNRGDTPSFVVQFLSGGVVVDPDPTTLHFAAKTDGQYDQNPPLVLTGPFVKSGSGGTAAWTASPSFASTAINTALAVDGAANNDKPSLTAMGQFTWVKGLVVDSTEPFAVTIRNNVYRSSDTAP